MPEENRVVKGNPFCKSFLNSFRVLIRNFLDYDDGYENPLLPK
jgi:hypothetical protein